MTDQEFYELYGRMPRRTQPGKKKVKIYWGRIIIALIILVLIIVGIVKLIGFTVRKIKGSGESSQENTAVSVNDTESIIKQDTSSDAEVTPVVIPDESSSSEPEPAAEDIELTVCIDPAHGGYDDGATYLNGIRIEKYDTLNIAARLRDEFESRGVTVCLTRVDDTFTELYQRCSLAANTNCDLYLSIHRGSSDDPNVCGVEAYVHSEKPATDVGFAKSILDKLEESGVSANNGVKCGYVTDPGSDYYTNAYTPMPSVLLNIGYISNENDNYRLDSDLDAYCKAIVDGVIDEAKARGIIDENGKRTDASPLKSEKNSLVPGSEDEVSFVPASTPTTSRAESKASDESSSAAPADSSSQAAQSETVSEPSPAAEPQPEEPMYTEDGLGTYTDPMMTNG